MDHGWYTGYTHDLAEMQGWRRLACYTWSSLLAFLVAAAYLALARAQLFPSGDGISSGGGMGIFTLATVFLSPTEWVIRGALALVFAALQLPPVVVSVALMRPSPVGPGRYCSLRQPTRCELSILEVSCIL